MTRAVRTGWMIVGTLVCSLSLANGVERLVRVYASESGLDAQTVGAMAQDERGFIWVGTNRDISRFDGRQFVPLNREPLTRHPESLAIDPRDGVLFVDLQQPFRLEDGARVPYEPPVEPPLESVTHLERGLGGRLWIADARAVHTRDVDGTWSSWPTGSFGEQVWWLEPISESAALAISWRAVWKLELDGSIEELYRTDRWLTRAVITDAGDLLVAEARPDSNGARLVEVVDKQARRVLVDRVVGWPLDITQRGRVVWLTSSAQLIRHDPLGTTEVFRDRDPLNGELRLMDAEGGLWIAGARGLLHVVEPRTSALTANDGLIQARSLHLRRSADGLFVMQGPGFAFIDIDGDSVRARAIYEGNGFRRGCLDGDGRYWNFINVPNRGDRLVRFSSSGELKLELHDQPRVGSCTESSAGGVWLAMGSVLRRSLPGGGIEDVLPLQQPTPHAILQAASGDLWVTHQSDICRLSADALARREPAWECSSREGMYSIGQILETESGQIWISTFQGVFRWSGTEWVGVRGMPVGHVSHAISASPQGGYWVSTNTEGLVRVIEKEAHADYSVEIVETLSSRAGLLTDSGMVHEESDGTLWIASDRGVQRVPADVRFREAPVPRVAFVSGRAGETPLVDSGLLNTLPSFANDVELFFAAPTYRDRSGLVFRTRTNGGDDWDVTRVPELRFVDLVPGRYDIEVQASMDGESWSGESAVVSLVIQPPWYRTWWAYAFALVLGAAVVYALYRTRLAFLVGLERQRTRIAMDLHDEMGSGLGSISVLSGVLSGDSIDSPTRVQLANQIDSNAGDLATALSDIVWSLRSRALWLGAIVDRLENRANQLLPNALVVVDKHPDAKRTRCSVDVSKNLLSIGVEAIHNAAKHADPKQLTLALTRDGLAWCLIIEDDGKGMSLERDSGSGLGLASMKARCSVIGAEMVIDSTPGGGTRIEIRFAASTRRGVRAVLPW